MAKKEQEKEEKRNNKNGKNSRSGKDEKKKDSILSNWTKRWIKAIVLFLIAVIVVLSFPYFEI